MPGAPCSGAATAVTVGVKVTTNGSMTLQGVASGVTVQSGGVLSNFGGELDGEIVDSGLIDGSGSIGGPLTVASGPNSMARRCSSGATLTLSEAGKTYGFTLAGATAVSYTVAGDGAGGTLIRASTTAMVQTIAAFAAPGAAQTVPATGSASSATTLFGPGHR